MGSSLGGCSSGRYHRGCALRDRRCSGCDFASRQSRGVPTVSVPRIVAQVTGKDTMYSNTYRLSNGQYQAQIFAQPIRFKGARGNWQNFNTSLVAPAPPASTVPPTCRWQSRSARLATAASPLNFRPRLHHHLERAEHSGRRAPGPGPSAASYLGVANETTLSYKVLNWGVEQSLTLASNAAPASFTCTVSHPGLTMAQTPAASGASTFRATPCPLFFLSGISVYDASHRCQRQPGDLPGATMSVVPGNGRSTLTYSVPRSWLADPARVYPVTIDPAVTLNPTPGDNAYCDTWIDSGNPGSSHGASASETSGYTTADGNSTVVPCCSSTSRVSPATTSIRPPSSSTRQTCTATHRRSRCARWTRAGTTARPGPAPAPRSTAFLPASAVASSAPTTRATTSGCRSTAPRRCRAGSRALPPTTAFSSTRRRTARRAPPTTANGSLQTTPATRPTGRSSSSTTTPYPSASPSGYATAYAEGNTVSATVNATTAYPGDVSDIRLGIDRNGEGGRAIHGVLAWWAYKPPRQAMCASPPPTTAATLPTTTLGLRHPVHHPRALQLHDQR